MNSAAVRGFTFALSLLSGVIFGLAPALQSSRPDVNIALKGDGAPVGAEARRYTRGALVPVAMLACYIPALRATKVDPAVALRQE